MIKIFASFVLMGILSGCGVGTLLMLPIKVPLMILTDASSPKEESLDT